MDAVKTFALEKSPMKPNLKFNVEYIRNDLPLEEVFAPILLELKMYKRQTAKTLIFCQTISQAAIIWRIFEFNLGKEMYAPEKQVPDNRLVEMIHAVSITPNYTISFLSKCYGGQASDIHITEESGLGKKLLPLDQVMAERGFKIENYLSYNQCMLPIPPSTIGSKQTDKTDVQNKTVIANVGIFVEKTAYVAASIC
eukprot:gene10147-18812_t